MVALAIAPTIAQGTAVAAFVASSDMETAESKLPEQTGNISFLDALRITAANVLTDGPHWC